MNTYITVLETKIYDNIDKFYDLIDEIKEIDNNLKTNDGEVSEDMKILMLEIVEHYDKVKKDLIQSLEEYFTEEVKYNHPVNSAFRKLYKRIKV